MGGRATFSVVVTDAWVFDTDGILTDCASAHARAWSITFEQFFASPAADVLDLSDRRPFQGSDDYRPHLDGISRREGIRRFLRSRGAEERDGNDFEMVVVALAQQKHDHYRRILGSGTVSGYRDVPGCLERLRRLGCRLGVVSASENTRPLLSLLGLDSSFDVCVDGRDMTAEALPDKPAPAALLRASELLDTPPERTGVVVSTVDGARAGRAGGYARVIGVVRDDGPTTWGPPGALTAHVEAVISSLDELR